MVGGLELGASFANQVIMITGAARGQGRMHAIRFAELGARLIICDVCNDLDSIRYGLADASEFAALCEELEAKTNQQLLAEVCDVRDGRAVAHLARRGYERFGRIDILVNNAGVCKIESPFEIDNSSWDTMIGVNLTGTWNGCRAVMPMMKEQGWGRIINIGSIAGLKGIPNLSHYVAAKHGVVGLTKALAIDLAPYGITVNCVCPGSVETPMLEGLAPEIGHSPETAKEAFASFHLLPGLVQPEDITELVVWLASVASRSVTGVAWNIDRGWLQH